MKVPSINIQAPEKLQAPNFKWARGVYGLVLGYRNFSGSWKLELGTFLA
jgi:hypothetical protein